MEVEVAEEDNFKSVEDTLNDDLASPQHLASMTPDDNDIDKVFASI